MSDRDLDALKALQSIFGINLPPYPPPSTPHRDEFEEWYTALTQSKPSLRLKDTITLTPDNFRKALHQAWRAGRDSLA